MRKCCSARPNDSTSPCGCAACSARRTRCRARDKRCFVSVLVLVLSRAVDQFRRTLSKLMVQMGIRYLAFVATPQCSWQHARHVAAATCVGLRLPAWWALPAGGRTGGVAVPAGPGILAPAHHTNPAGESVCSESYTAVHKAAACQATGLDGPLGYTLGGYRCLWWCMLGAVSEELAFRGFILSVVSKRRFKPWTAVFISSFLFALSQMNVFQFVPHFVVGLAGLSGRCTSRQHIAGHALSRWFSTPSVLGRSCFPKRSSISTTLMTNLVIGSAAFSTLTVVCLAAAVGLLIAIRHWTDSDPRSFMLDGDREKVRDAAARGLADSDRLSAR